ncbi:helix-turn-helix domain-containing protein [Streptomyces sp. C]|uniref:helix-turn-helix domain-containing protein n=1 Tax=Streptomyces sp. C TaxID=253839 RepID=UPI0013EB5F2B|nr:helix-turn-helix domain-containing protein [Streptomyces sp. C]
MVDPGFEAAFEDARGRSALLRRLASLRKVRRISQRTVAERMETTQSAVSDLESGATDPRVSTLQRYARAVGCRIEFRVCDDGGEWRYHETYEVRSRIVRGGIASPSTAAAAASGFESKARRTWDRTVYSVKQERTSR